MHYHRFHEIISQESSQITTYFDAIESPISKADDSSAVNQNNNVVKSNISEPMAIEEEVDNNYKHMLDDDNDDAAFLELDF